MVQRPRPDLRGGCAAMRIPTVTGGRGSATTPPTRPVMLSPTPTHAEIASRINPLREAVTLALNRLVEVGLIERRKGKLIILDVTRLARLVHEVIGG